MGAIHAASQRAYRAISRALVPGLRNAQHAYIALLEELVTPATRWLDLGCGHMLVPEWMRDAAAREAALVGRATSVTGIDLDLPALRRHRTLRRRAMADLERLPFPDAAFDLVTANMVVEHLPRPAAVLAELRRVLAPGGRFVFHTPNFLYPPMALAHPLPAAVKHRLIALLEGRPAHDVFPTFYRLNRPRRIAALAQQAGLVLRDLRHVESAPVTAPLGPLALPELALIRLSRTHALRTLRANLIAVLEKT